MTRQADPWPRAISVNGRFLGRPISGVERYGREILLAWDAMLGADESHPPVRILLPKGVEPDLPLRHMTFASIGRLSGHAWEQIELAAAARHDVLISLANAGPLFHRRHIAVIHDAAVFRFPQNYGWRYSLFHRLMNSLLARNARLMTVSNFSQGELARFLHVDHDAITLCPNGSEHLGRIIPDDSIIQRLPLADQPFVLAVGSISKNKNLPALLKAWEIARITGMKLVIAGPVAQRIFGTQPSLPTLPGVIMAGRVTDAELTALYRRAAAFIFPSRYEGFGIPPLEAMYNGCPVFASDIPSVREICGDAATYFPHDQPEILAQILSHIQSGQGLTDKSRQAQARVEIYSWAKSAAILSKAALAALAVAQGAG